MHVYLIHATGTNRYKIGITNRSIESRLNELNGSQSAYPLELITNIRSANYKAVERHLHERYSAYRKHGEWFEFDSYQLAEVQHYMSQLDTKKSEIKPILKPLPQTVNSGSRLPSLPFKDWILPLMVGLGIFYACHSVDFLKPAPQQPTHKTKGIQS